jgi:hypothetical protein
MLLTGDVASRRLSPILPGDEWLARMNEGGRSMACRAEATPQHAADIGPEKRARH